MCFWVKCHSGKCQNRRRYKEPDFPFSVLRRHGGRLEPVGRLRSPPGRREGQEPDRRLLVAQAVVVHHEVRQLFIVDDVDNIYCCNLWP
jgi:hypothetical protein